MSQMKTRFSAIVSTLILLTPLTAFAIDGDASAPSLVSEAVAAAAPVSAIGQDEDVETFSFTDLILGFFHSAAQVGAPESGTTSAGTTPSEEDRGAAIDPMGRGAN